MGGLKMTVSAPSGVLEKLHKRLTPGLRWKTAWIPEPDSPTPIGNGIGVETNYYTIIYNYLHPSTIK